MDTRRLTTPLMRDNTIVTAHTTRSHGAHHDTHAGMHPMRACNTCRTHAALVNVEVGAERSAAARKACDEPKKCASTLKNAKGSVAQKTRRVLGRGDESATRQTLARSARGAAAEAAAVIGASESPRRRSYCSCDRRRPSPSGWSTHRSIAGTARRRTRPRAGRAASARRSAVPPSPPGWPRAADHRRLKQTAQRPRRDEEVSIMWLQCYISPYPGVGKGLIPY